MLNAEETEWEPFLAKGRSLEALTAYLVQLDRHKQHWLDVQTELGAVATWWQGSRGVGWRFADGAATSASVRATRRKPALHEPNPKTTAGKALAQRMALHPHPGDLAPRVFEGAQEEMEFVAGRAFLVWVDPSGFRTRGVGAEKVGDQWILQVAIPYKKEHAPCPPDAVSLKRSDYWRLKEAAADAAECRLEGSQVARLPGFR